MQQTTLTVEELESVLQAVKDDGNEENIAYWEAQIAAKTNEN